MSQITSLINHRFGGIRRKDSSFSEDKITCSDCENIELFFTELNSGIGVRTSSGNKSVTQYMDEDVLRDLIPDDEYVIGMFETNQDGMRYFIVYTESSTQGKLYVLDLITMTLTSKVTGLSVTGNACAVDFVQGILDMFIFSNGKEIKYIYSNTDTHEKLVVESAGNIHLVDVEGNPVMGIGLAVFDSRLWIFNERTLWYSQQSECRTFNYVDPDAVTSSGLIPFVKPITAIYPYLGSLAVFHKDSSALVTTDSTTLFKVGDESPGGCAGYDALVFHGTDLYFYDDTKKGVFSFQQVINGDKTLGDNIAYDIQDELQLISDVNKIRTLSLVTADRNEVWFITPISATYTKGSETKEATIVLIFDYIRGEWVKRRCPKIYTAAIINNVFYSGGKSVYREYYGKDFNGDYIPAFYTCSIFNYGSDNTLKITKFPPRVTLDSEKNCHFWVKYVKNYDSRRSVKQKELTGKTNASNAFYDSGFYYDSGVKYESKNSNVILKLPSSTFKALEITLYTTDREEAFILKTMEFSKLKVKQV